MATPPKNLPKTTSQVVGSVPTRPRSNSTSSSSPLGNHRQSPRNGNNPGTLDNLLLPIQETLPRDLKQHMPPAPGYIPNDAHLPTLEKHLIKQIAAVTEDGASQTRKRRTSSIDRTSAYKGELPPPASVIPGVRPASPAPPPGTINPVGMGGGSPRKTPPMSPKRRTTEGGSTGNPFADESEASSDERVAPSKKAHKITKIERIAAVEAQNVELLKLVQTLHTKVETLTTNLEMQEKAHATSEGVNFVLLSDVQRVVRGDVARNSPIPRLPTASTWNPVKPSDQVISSTQRPLASTQTSLVHDDDSDDDGHGHGPSLWEFCCGCLFVPQRVVGSARL
jgi:hypothetical protein